MEEDEPIEHRMVTRAIERAQKQVEAQNFDIRKHLLEYDDVMNKQREAIYKLRRDILDGSEGREYVMNISPRHPRRADRHPLPARSPIRRTGTSPACAPRSSRTSTSTPAA